MESKQLTDDQDNNGQFIDSPTLQLEPIGENLMPVLSEEEKAIRASPKHDLEHPSKLNTTTTTSTIVVDNLKLSSSKVPAEEKNPELDSPKIVKENSTSAQQESIKDQEYDPLQDICEQDTEININSFDLVQTPKLDDNKQQQQPLTASRIDSYDGDQGGLNIHISQESGNDFIPKRDFLSPSQHMKDHLNHSGGLKEPQSEVEGDNQKSLQDQFPGKILAEYINNSKHSHLMESSENQVEFFNILINTSQGHPALKKYVKHNGIPPLYQICLKIRENKLSTMGDNKNKDEYKRDLRVFKKLVSALKNLPITSKVLTDTRIGRGVNSIVKDGIFKPEWISETALNLVNEWKAIVHNQHSQNSENKTLSQELKKNQKHSKNENSNNIDILNKQSNSANLINQKINSQEDREESDKDEQPSQKQEPSAQADDNDDFDEEDKDEAIEMIDSLLQAQQKEKELLTKRDFNTTFNFNKQSPLSALSGLAACINDDHLDGLDALSRQFQNNQEQEEKDLANQKPPHVKIQSLNDIKNETAAQTQGKNNDQNPSAGAQQFSPMEATHQSEISSDNFRGWDMNNKRSESYDDDHIITVKKVKHGKRVKWFDDNIETVRFFKLTDSPIAPSLDKFEVIEVQQRTANVPSHMIYSELKKLDMKMDRQKFEQQKLQEQKLKVKLQDMRPMAKFHRQILKEVRKDDNYFRPKSASKESEQNEQKYRESMNLGYFSAQYFQGSQNQRGVPNQIVAPQNPFKELDEIYAQDDDQMVIVHNLEENTEDQIKHKEIEKYKDDIGTMICQDSEFSNLQQEQQQDIHQFIQSLQSDANRLLEDELNLRQSTLINIRLLNKQGVQAIKAMIQKYKDLNQQRMQQMEQNAAVQKRMSEMQQQAQQQPSVNHGEQIRLPQQQMHSPGQQNQQAQIQGQGMSSGALKEIKFSNYRTVPCKNYHGPQGCQRGDYCHFIHAVQFEKQNLPREVFQQYRNENMRKNMLDGIKEVDQKMADELDKNGANYFMLQAHINAHNAKIRGEVPNGAIQGGANPIPQLVPQQFQVVDQQNMGMGGVQQMNQQLQMQMYMQQQMQRQQSQNQQQMQGINSNSAQFGNPQTIQTGSNMGAFAQTQPIINPPPHTLKPLIPPQQSIEQQSSGVGQQPQMQSHPSFPGQQAQTQNQNPQQAVQQSQQQNMNPTPQQQQQQPGQQTQQQINPQQIAQINQQFQQQLLALQSQLVTAQNSGNAQQQQLINQVIMQKNAQHQQIMQQIKQRIIQQQQQQQQVNAHLQMVQFQQQQQQQQQQQISAGQQGPNVGNQGGPSQLNDK